MTEKNSIIVDMEKINTVQLIQQLNKTTAVVMYYCPINFSKRTCKISYDQNRLHYQAHC